MTKRIIKTFIGKTSKVEEEANEFAAVQKDVEIASASLTAIDNMGTVALAVVYEKTKPKTNKSEKKEETNLL